MNSRLEDMKQRVRDGDHRMLRQKEPVNLLEECEAKNLSWMQRAALLTVRQCQAEIPVVLPDERIVFTRTLPVQIPALYSAEEYAGITAGRTVHELGPVNNILADWGQALAQGLLGRKRAALEKLERCKDDPETIEFLTCSIETIDAVLELAGRYAQAARDLGRMDVAETLEHVPAHPPRTFREALQAMRLLTAVVWLSGHYHVGLGRFDQYMWPYLKADLEAGRLDENKAVDLLAEFFISMNKDSDLYPGVQQGDNGQSLTLGGVDREGNESINELTSMVLIVSRDLAMIDPKINLRISPRTRLDLLALASELTRKGLGFPQYSNDDVVIPGLVAHGYREEDARDYSVAACWEFIIPGRGMEVVNIGAVSFPHAVDQALRQALPRGGDMDAILKQVEKEITQQVHHLARIYEKLLLPRAVLFYIDDWLFGTGAGPFERRRI
jgi:pyruvate-formate lyase